MIGQGTRQITVIIDGNNHQLTTNDGKRLIFKTEITDNKVTLAKCQELADAVRKLGHEPRKLQLMLSIYEDYTGDGVPNCLLDKDVYYFADKNCMRIWQDGKPVYENNNGIICDDPWTLADCLL